MSSESDSDYSYAGELDQCEVEDPIVRVARVNKNGVKVRGKDIAWVEIHRFVNAKDYKESDIARKVEKEFTARKQKEYSYADVKMYHCRFSRKVGYLPCPWQIKLSFLSHCSAVTVETVDGIDEHKHEEDPQYEADPGAVFKWTEEMTKIVEDCVRNNQKPNVVKRNLTQANVFGLRKPSKVQLYNKIAAVKKKVFPSSNIVNTHQLRQRISEILEVADSEVEGFVPYWEVIDDKEGEEPRFCVVFTTKKNQGKIGCNGLLQNDATYRLNWMGFPVFVLGNVLFLNSFLKNHIDTFYSRNIHFNWKVLCNMCNSGLA